MNFQQKKDRLSALRQNMANKMVAGVDYDKEEDEIVRLSAEIKAEAANTQKVG